MKKYVFSFRAILFFPVLAFETIPSVIVPSGSQVFFFGI
jgi:hypothetical protein